MAYGIVLRASTFSYHGPARQFAFNGYVQPHLGAYSDIASLYFRDHMWLHHLPYIHYAFEYPVGTGMFAWLTGLTGGGVGVYLAVNAAVLMACGLLTIWLMQRLPDTNPWLLALAPALALYVVLNWDLLSIAALMVSLVLFHRGRDEWGAAALGVATWTKLFPVIALPVVLFVRLLDASDMRERARAAARLLIPFGVVTAVINGPFVFKHGAHGGLVVSSSWFEFFRFNTQRRGGGSLWALIDNGRLPVSTENLASALLVVAGLAVIFGAIAWVKRRRGTPARELVGPALLASFGWFFFTIKLYSPQYDLWVLVLVAVAGAPIALAVAFAAADVGFFAVAFSQFRLNSPWVEIHVTRPTIVIREAALLALVAWAVSAIVRPRDRRSQPLPVVEPPSKAVPALTGVPE
jgi:uncharacterized membrane protein